MEHYSSGIMSSATSTPNNGGAVPMDVGALSTGEGKETKDNSWKGKDNRGKDIKGNVHTIKGKGKKKTQVHFSSTLFDLWGLGP